MNLLASPAEYNNTLYLSSQITSNYMKDALATQNNEKRSLTPQEQMSAQTTKTSKTIHRKNILDPPSFGKPIKLTSK